MAERVVEQRTKQSMLSDLMRKQNDIRNMLDTRANIIIGFNSALVLFLISGSAKEMLGGFTFSIILITLILSLFSAILALKPPKFLRKKGQAESIFYHDYMTGKPEEEYEKEVFEVMDEEKMIFRSYITEAYNMSKFSNKPKKFYAHLSIRILIYGILITIIFYSISMALR